MGKSTTTKSVQENKPPAWAKPLFEKSAAEATKLYDSGTGFNTYKGDTVSDLSGTTWSGIRTLRRTDGDAKNPAFGVANNTFSQANAGKLGTDAANQYNAVYGQAMAPGAAEKYLTSTARGDYLKGSPFLNDIIARDSADIANSTAGMFAANGRYGSGAAGGAVADSVGDYRLNALQQNYQLERDRQIGAANALEGAQNAGYATALNAAQGNQSADAQNAAMRMQGASQMADLAQNRFTNQLAVGQAQMAAGQAIDQQAQKELAARIQKFYAEDMKDWTRLGALQSAAQGAAGPYGTATSATTQPGNPLGILGLLGSMFMSDIRLKDHIEVVGETAHGLPLYEFNYIGKPERYRGVMAQDVLTVMPEAVAEIDGFYAVNYGMLGVEMERVN